MAEPQMPATPQAAPAGRRKPWLVMGVIAAAAVAAILATVLDWRGTVSTDDAFLESPVTGIGANVAGRIATVAVADNQRVAAGDVLFTLDDQPYRVKVDQAAAAVALAEATLTASRRGAEYLEANVQATIAENRAGVGQAEALLAAAQADVAKADAEAERAALELRRFRDLGAAGSEQQLQDAEAAARTTTAERESLRRKAIAAEAEIASAQGRLAVAQAGAHQVEAAQAAVERSAAALAQAKADLRARELDLAYTVVKAPTAGTVARKSAEPGAYLQPGQPALALVGDGLWVVANFKETDLAGVGPGRPARIRVDAAGGAAFAGHVDSVQAGSGARFSLFPAENATGNFVKVVQRVPVKIVFDAQPDPRSVHLAPGMSVVPEVSVR